MAAFAAVTAAAAADAVVAVLAAVAKSAFLALGTLPNLFRLTWVPVMVWLRSRLPDSECLRIS